MNRWLIVILPALFVGGVEAQESYRCKIDGAMVIQDRPCPGAVRRSDNMPIKREAVAGDAAAVQPQLSSVEATQSKLERDKQYINERVKARAYEREKDQAAEQIQNCDANVRAIEYEINQVADGYQRGAPLDAASAHALQLDAQRRQTKVTALQSQATARRAECDRMRVVFDRTYQK
jgi:hypothetical protein